MTLIKTSFLNFIAVSIKILTLLGINKVLAVFVGPVGYAALGQFQNAMQMITTFASGAINTGVVKYTAEYGEDNAKQQKIWKTAGVIALFGSFIIAIVIALANKFLAEWFLRDESYGGVFLYFAATLVFFKFNSLLLAALNGKKEVSLYVLANISGSLFSLLITFVMTACFGLYGALVALAIYQSFAFFTTLFLCRKAFWFKISYFFGEFDRGIAINLAKYTAMALTSAVCIPASHMFVRNYLGGVFGWETAGYWEAMWRLSSAYLMLVTTTLGVYYLPRLSELKTIREIRGEILLGYKFILPVAIVSGICMYLLRDFIVLVLFSRDFYPVRVFFAWQIVGDILKIGGWILAYLMLSKAMVRLFVVSEIIFSVSFILLTVLFTKILGVKGVSVAHAVNYFFYWALMVFFIWKKIPSFSSK